MAQFELNFPRGKKAVIGIDLGTAYSGVSYMIRNDTATVNASAPRAINPQVKEPTVMLKTEDNHWLFGHAALDRFRNEAAQADPNNTVSTVSLFKLFKLDLMTADQVNFEDIYIDAVNTAVTEGLLDVYIQTLSKLKDHGLACVQQNYGEAVLSSEVLWVLTIPAEMTDYCKMFMRQAAFQARLISEVHSTDLTFIFEPEAAAVALAHEDKTGFFGQGNKFIVVDCGGGTVDITAHEVRNAAPLALSSLAQRAGGNYGSEKVNENFQNWLQARLNGLGADVLAEIRLRASVMFEVMESFDKIKIELKKDGTIAFISLRDLLDDRDTLDAFGGIMEEYNTNADPALRVNYIKRNGNLQLSYALVLSFFEPMISNIIRDTKQVRADAGQRGHRINSIVCVGGFSACEVLQDRMNTEFGRGSGVNLLFPNLRLHPQAAVVVGAARSGSLMQIGNAGGGAAGGGPILNRIATKTIGAFFEPDTFRPLVHIGDDVPVNSTKSLVGFPLNLKQTECQWKLYQSDKPNPTSVVGETMLGMLTVKVPQVGTVQDREMRANFTFGEAEIIVKVDLPHQGREETGAIRFGRL